MRQALACTNGGIARQPGQSRTIQRCASLMDAGDKDVCNGKFLVRMLSRSDDSSVCQALA